MSVENIYGIASGPDDAPQFHYVGKTVIAVESYWKYVHCKNYEADTRKSLYEHIRRNGGIDLYRIILLDTTANGLTEHDYVKILTLAGHKLHNDNAGNRKVQAKPSKAKSTFALLNKQAEERLETVERRKRLHNASQNLSKAELTRQRITGEYPGLEELQAALWVECPAELLGVTKASSAERAMYCKFGDVSILVAYRRKDKQTCCVVRRRDGSELNLDQGWCGAPLENWLRYVSSWWNTEDATWLQKYAA